MDIETYALAKAYTDKEIAGGGAIKGKNCVITEIEEISGGHIVHFQWTLDDGTVETDTMTVMDGEDGTVVSASETNGNIVIDGIETQVYDDSELQGIVSTDETTIEGNPLNFSTKSAQTAVSTIIDLEPIQDLHGYGYPWIGGAGKNLYVGSPSFDGYNNISLWTKESETYNGHDVYSNTSNWRGLNKAITLGAGIYTFSCTAKSSTSGTKMYFYGLGSSVLREVSLTTSWVKYSISITLNEETTVSLRVETNSETAQALYVTEYQIEVGSQATSYEPYENICPITGRTQDNILGCGKNLVDKTKANLNKILDETNGNLIDFNGGWVCDYIFVGVGKTYHFPARGSHRTAFYDTNKIFKSALGISQDAQNWTATENGYIRLTFFTSTLSPDDCQIEIGTSATSYEPYTLSNDITISFGDTVFGARHDVGRGLLVVDRVYNNITSADYYGNYGIDNAPLFFKEISEYVKGYDTDVIAKPISNFYNAVPYSQAEVMKNGEIRTQVANSTKRFYFRDDRFNSKAEIDAWLANNPLEIVGTLSVPITIEVTPHQIALLEGINNISTDGDKITLTYRDGSVATLGDVKALGDNLTQEIADSQILTDTVTGDKYKLVVTSGVLSIEQISN